MFFSRSSSIALERDRVDGRRGTHAREHARSTTSARARIVESSPSARAISRTAGARTGTMAMRASVSARAAIATTTVRARRDARWTREKTRGDAESAREGSDEIGARVRARATRAKGGSGSRRARSYLQTRAEAREPGRARDARGMMARDDGEERWRGRRTRERWARRATRRREAGRLTTRGFSKRAGDEGENDARGARDAGGSGDARRRHWTARTAEEEG